MYTPPIGCQHHHPLASHDREQRHRSTAAASAAVPPLPRLGARPLPRSRSMVTQQAGGAHGDERHVLVRCSGDIGGHLLAESPQLDAPCADAARLVRSYTPSYEREKDARVERSTSGFHSRMPHKSLGSSTVRKMSGAKVLRLGRFATCRCLVCLFARLASVGCAH